MSAIADSTDGPVEKVKVLFTLFPGYNTLDVAGPLEVLSRSLQNPKDKCKVSGQFQPATRFLLPVVPIGPLLTHSQPARLLSASLLAPLLP